MDTEFTLKYTCVILLGTEWGWKIASLRSLSMKAGFENHWVALVLQGGGWASHHSAGGGLWHTNTLLPCDFLSPLSPPFRTKGTQSLTFVLVVPPVRGCRKLITELHQNLNRQFQAAFLFQAGYAWWPGPEGEGHRGNQWDRGKRVREPPADAPFIP